MLTQDAGTSPSTNALPTEIASLSPDQLRSLMGQETPEGNSLLVAAGVKSAAAPEITSDATVDPTPPESYSTQVDSQTSVSGETPAESGLPEEDDEGPKRRVRPRSDLDHQVLDLYKSSGFKGTFQEAVAVIYGQSEKTQNTGQVPNTEANAPEVDPATEIDRTIDTRRTEVTDLERQIDEAAELMDTAKALKLQRELTRKENEIVKLEDLKQVSATSKQASVDAAFRDKAASAKATALERYPQLADKDSIVRKQFDVFLDKAETDPDLAPLFNSSRWPSLLAEEFARQSNMAPSSRKAASKAAAFDSQTSTRATQAKVLTTATTPPAATAPTSETELRALLPKLTPSQLRQLMGK